MPPENGKPDNIATTVTEVSERMSTLVREEIELAKAEITEKVTSIARGTAAVAAGAVFGDRADWDWHRDRTGQTCGYVSVDATGIQMQGPDGAKADGRMVYLDAATGKELRLGALDEPADDEPERTMRTFRSDEIRGAGPGDAYRTPDRGRNY